MWRRRVPHRHRPQSGHRGRAGHVGRNLHTEEQVGRPGGKTGRLLQGPGPGGHTLPHVLLQGARNTERHLTEPALVDVLPNPPVSLHVSGSKY